MIYNVVVSVLKAIKAKNLASEQAVDIGYYKKCKGIMIEGKA